MPRNPILPPTAQEKAAAAINHLARDPALRIVLLILLGFILGRL